MVTQPHGEPIDTRNTAPWNWDTWTGNIETPRPNLTQMVLRHLEIKELKFVVYDLVIASHYFMSQSESCVSVSSVPPRNSQRSVSCLNGVTVISAVLDFPTANFWVDFLINSWNEFFHKVENWEFQFHQACRVDIRILVYSKSVLLWMVALYLF